MQATTQALDHLLRAVGDPIAELLHVGPGHREFRRAQAIRAGVGVISKMPEAFPAIARALRARDDAPISPQVRAHFAAAEAWLAGDPVLAAETYAAILTRWPHDLLALRVAQSCFFFLGWHDRLCALVDTVLPAWSQDRRGFQFALAMASFIHAENGNASYAEALGREALARDPACPLGVHAVAHAIAESARPASGAQWMREQRAHWVTESRMRTHNAWHLAMFDIESGNAASALRILDAWLIPASASSALDACDATDLLWNLAAAGVDVEQRWSKISDAFAGTLTPGFWPYVDLHAALAHLTAKESMRAERLTRAIAERARGNDYAARRARHITRPGLRALRAWTDGRYARAARYFAALQPLLGEAGGSRVQLEIFRRIGQEAARRQLARQCHRTLPLPTAIVAADAELDSSRARIGRSHDATKPAATAALRQ